MREIEIVYDMPVIFTKDRDWMLKTHPVAKPGAVVVLPDDAVLYVPRQEVSIAVSDLQLKDLEPTRSDSKAPSCRPTNKRTGDT